jgi:hypothetical protein
MVIGHILQFMAEAVLAEAVDKYLKGEGAKFHFHFHSFAPRTMVDYFYLNVL